MASARNTLVPFEQNTESWIEYYSKRADRQGHRNALTKEIKVPEVNAKLVSPIGQILQQAQSQLQMEKKGEVVHQKPIKPKLDTGDASSKKNTKATGRKKESNSKYYKSNQLRDIFG